MGRRRCHLAKLTVEGVGITGVHSLYAAGNQTAIIWGRAGRVRTWGDNGTTKMSYTPLLVLKESP